MKSPINTKYKLGPMPRVIPIIESDVLRGSGTDENPYRRVMQYHSLDGKLLAEYDSCTAPRDEE